MLHPLSRCTVQKPVDTPGWGRKICWLPGAAVPLWPVQHTRVSCRCQRWTRSNSLSRGAVLGAAWGEQEGAAGAEGLPALLPCWKCQGPAPGWQQSRYVCNKTQPPQHCFSSGTSLRSSSLELDQASHRDRGQVLDKSLAANTALLNVPGQSPKETQSQSRGSSSLVHILLSFLLVEVCIILGCT